MAVLTESLEKDVLLRALLRALALEGETPFVVELGDESKRLFDHLERAIVESAKFARPKTFGIARGA